MNTESQYTLDIKTKENISEILKGYQRDSENKGWNIKS
jgi:hypothetical protein